MVPYLSFFICQVKWDDMARHILILEKRIINHCYKYRKYEKTYTYLVRGEKYIGNSCKISNFISIS